MTEPWLDLEHRLWAQIKKYSLQKKSLIVALSGGLDSVSLLFALARLQKAGELRLTACYVHHGLDENQAYRDQAQGFCEDYCLKLNIPFFIGGPSLESLKSEEALREFRYQELGRIMREQGCDFLVLGHHRDDLFETRMIRLIRGTGIEGLSGMSIFAENKWRPFLEFSRVELATYAQHFSLGFLDDPSNLSQDPLRNWLRLDWLPQLEQKRQGSLEALSRSLSNISDFIDLKHSFKEVYYIERELFKQLSDSEKAQLLAQHLRTVLRAVGKSSFSSSQLKEVIKQLDNPQKVFSFKCAGCHWAADARQIVARPE